MFPVERALLIINRAAGTGQGESIAEKLTLLFKQGLAELSDVHVESVSDHPAARACAAKFISESEAPALVVAGGGGGTLRAVIEGTFNSRQRVRVGALRMGSGNLIAKEFGVPNDPVLGLNGLLTNLKAGRTVPCCVMRCETWTSSGKAEVHHAVGLGGLGQFGRAPSDVARLRSRLSIFHKGAARLFGIEKVNNSEYGLAVLIRAVSSMLSSNGAETIEIQFQGQTERLRLLSGIVMNFPIRALPFKPSVTVEDEALEVYLIPHKGSFSPLLQLAAPQRLAPHTRRIRIEKDQRLEIRLLDRDCVELFLDEDPVTTHKRLSLEVAGLIAFVPGPDYQSIVDRGVSK